MNSGARLPFIGFSHSHIMVDLAKTVSEEAVVSAAQYSSKIPYTKRIQVAETLTVPSSTTGTTYLFNADGVRELPGERMAEEPDDNARFESRDHRVTYIAYAPVGSIGHSEAPARGADIKSQASFIACHGAGLNGASAPPLSGRSLNEFIDLSAYVGLLPVTSVIKSAWNAAFKLTDSRR
jgi:hypothetical protein